MGEAKRRKAAGLTSSGEAFASAVRDVGSALRRLARAASGHLGSDCYLHAELGRLLLADLGIETKRVVGHAAWRVGHGSGDVIAHSPEVTGHLEPGALGYAYHSWLVCGDKVIDFTTYQLPLKAAQLDAFDGGTTRVEWAPDVLVMPTRALKSFRQVGQAAGPIAVHYEPHPELEPDLLVRFEVDQEDLAAARLLLANPEMQAFGPNDAASV